MRPMTKHEKRDGSGRYSAGFLCDFCNKPTGANYETDSDVCGSADGMDRRMAVL